MKFINVNVNLQFDSQGEINEREQALIMVMLINENISNMFPASQPQLSIDKDAEVIVIEPTEDEQ